MNHEEFYRQIAENIRNVGLQVIGVGGDHTQPTFTYTVGLSERVGYELIAVGLPYKFAHQIFNDIALNHLLKDEPLALEVPDDRFTNMPVKFRECHPDLVCEYGVQAYRYYDRDDIRFVQMVMCDRAGLFPEDPNYDHRYMGPRQKLLYAVDNVVQLHTEN